MKNFPFTIPCGLVIFILTFSIYGCGGPYSDAPKIEFLNSIPNKEGVIEVSLNPTIKTKIELSKPEDRPVFIEILTDEEYLQGKAHQLIPGDDWGGKRLTGQSDNNGIAIFQINDSDYKFRTGKKYWVRSGVFIGQGRFGVLVSLIEIPLDKRSGVLFETIRPRGSEAVRVRLGVGDFFPIKVNKSK